MLTQDFTSPDNVYKTTTIKGVLVNLCRVGHNIGWWCEIEGKKYGNYSLENGKWKKGLVDTTPEQALLENADKTINLIT